MRGTLGGGWHAVGVAAALAVGCGESRPICPAASAPWSIKCTTGASPFSSPRVAAFDGALAVVGHSRGAEGHSSVEGGLLDPAGWWRTSAWVWRGPSMTGDPYDITSANGGLWLASKSLMDGPRGVGLFEWDGLTAGVLKRKVFESMVGLWFPFHLRVLDFDGGHLVGSGSIYSDRIDMATVDPSSATTASWSLKSPPPQHLRSMATTGTSVALMSWNLLSSSGAVELFSSGLVSKAKHPLEVTYTGGALVAIAGGYEVFRGGARAVQRLTEDGTLGEVRRFWPDGGSSLVNDAVAWTQGGYIVALEGDHDSNSRPVDVGVTVGHLRADDSFIVIASWPLSAWDGGARLAVVGDVVFAAVPSEGRTNFVILRPEP